MSEAAQFYHDLPAFTEFEGLVEDERFVDVPEDWLIFVADVKGSTRAVQEGRYRDVNTVGAAAIAAVQNAVPRIDFPFVFGGDGATLLVPPDVEEQVSQALDGVRVLAEESFNLELRVGRISVGSLDNHSVRVGKFELVPGNCIAIFRGGGLARADDVIKSNEDTHVRRKNKSGADLTGLSCRWQAIPSRNHSIVSLIVMARTDQPDRTYRQVLEQIRECVGGSLEAVNPINTEDMKYKTVGECVRDEKRYHRRRWSFKWFYRLFEICASVLIFAWKVPPLFIFSRKHYVKSMPTHSDYRKFDDMLRMVIDCTEDQIQKIRALLEQGYLKGELFFGMHESAEALMTCLVEKPKDGRHLHFVDGGDGGYTTAATEMKTQIKRKNEGPDTRRWENPGDETASSQDGRNR